MKRRLQRLLLSFLLAWFPVQTMALPALSTLCVQHDAGEVRAAEQFSGQAHDQHAHDHAAAGNSHVHAYSHDAQTDTTAPDITRDSHASGSGNHPCCDHHFTAMLFTALSLPDSMAPAQVPALPHSPRLFVPEQPDHPPSL